MTLDSFRDEISDLITLLLESGIAISSTGIVIDYRSPNWRRITWATNKFTSGDLFRIESPTVSEYREWIASQGYSVLLFDGSFIQISYDFEDQELIAHRLMYFPCPFDLDQELLEIFPLVDVVDMYQESGTPCVRLRTPIRFDYDNASAANHHPASHMTFQWSHCRIPVVSPISLGHFIQFVFKNFYPNIWRFQEFLQTWPTIHFSPTITLSQSAYLHFSIVNS